MKQRKSKGYHIEKFATNEEWKKQRVLGIGSSEVGAIMNLSPFATPRDVWMSKLGMSAPIEENFSMEMGHAMEPWVAKCFEEHTGISIIKSSTGDWLAIDDNKPFLRVSPDRTYWIPEAKHNDEGKGIAECKTSFKNYSEDALFNECMYWYCQLQYQLHVMRLSEGYLCFMCLSREANGARWFVNVPYNQDFCCDIMIPALEEFWNKHVVPARLFLDAHKIKDPMHMSKEYEEAINEYSPACVNAKDVASKYKHQTEGKVMSAQGVSIPEGKCTGVASNLEDLLIRYPSICSQIKKLEDIKKEIEEVVKMKMGDAESIVDGTGKVLATWKQNKASFKFNDKLFKERNPEEYDKYLESKPGSRVLKIKS